MEKSVEIWFFFNIIFPTLNHYIVRFVINRTRTVKIPQSVTYLGGLRVKSDGFLLQKQERKLHKIVMFACPNVHVD